MKYLPTQGEKVMLFCRANKSSLLTSKDVECSLYTAQGTSGKAVPRPLLAPEPPEAKTYGFVTKVISMPNTDSQDNGTDTSMTLVEMILL